LDDLGAPISTTQTKYLELLARYYVLKGEHIAAARMLLILAERQCTSAEEAPALDQRSPDFISASFVHLHALYGLTPNFAIQVSIFEQCCATGQKCRHYR
jgi:hypothetical protein